MSQLRYSNYKRIFGNVETIQFSDTSLAFVSDREEQPLSTIKPLQSNKPLIEYQKATIGTYGGGRNIRLQHTPILYGHPQRDEEGGKLSTAFTPIEIPQGQPFARKSQLGGTITQHPEKQGFERGVTSAGFPTQEQMTGLGFRQGAASYKPQKYALGDEVTQQEELPPQQLAEEPPQSMEGQQIGNIEAAEEAGLSAQPELISEPQAAPEDEAADDIPRKVPKGSFVLNEKAVDIAGEDYIRDIMKKALKIADRNGVNINIIKGATGKEAVDILISNGEFIIPPELVGIIGEKQLKLINDRGIAAMKKEEQLEQSIYKGKDSKVGQYGGAETPPPPQQAHGRFIDMKKGYASGKTGEGVQQAGWRDFFGIVTDEEEKEILKDKKWGDPEFHKITLGKYINNAYKLMKEKEPLHSFRTRLSSVGLHYDGAMKYVQDEDFKKEATRDMEKLNKKIHKHYKQELLNEKKQHKESFLKTNREIWKDEPI